MLECARQFAQGFAAPVRASLFLVRHRRLWPLAIAPFMVNILLYAAGAALFVTYHNEITQMFMDRPQAWYWLLVYYVFRGLAYLIVATIFLFSFVYVGMIIAAPFLELLSERTETILSGTPMSAPFRLRNWIADILRSAGHALKTLAVLGLTFPLSFIPILGPVVWLGAGCLLLAYDFTSYSADRRRLSFRHKWRLVWSNAPGSVGFGLALFVLMAIPLVGLVMLPTVAVAGTMLFVSVWQR